MTVTHYNVQFKGLQKFGIGKFDKSIFFIKHMSTKLCSSLYIFCLEGKDFLQ